VRSGRIAIWPFRLSAPKATREAQFHDWASFVFAQSDERRYVGLVGSFCQLTIDDREYST
jgi:hypothetical protein